MKVRVEPSRIQGSLTAPPSKSYTHRAVILASLCEGVSTVMNPLLSRDTIATVDACRALGAEVSKDEELVVEGRLPLKVPDDVIDVENSGTTLRLITGIAALTEKGYSVLTGDESVRRRPMQPLLDALHTIGVRCWATRMNGCAPIIVEGGGIHGGPVTVSGGVSSQFISSLLIAAPLAYHETLLRIEGRCVSRPYIDATLKVIEHFGGRVVEEGIGAFRIPSQQKYTSKSFRVPGDFSSASFILAGGALTEGEVSVDGLDFSLPQGDAAVVDILKSMGADVSVDVNRGRVTVRGVGGLNGGKFNLLDTPDLLPIVAVLACRSEEEVLVRGVRHARFKETNRLSVLAEELPKLGVSVEELEDGLRVVGAKRLKRCMLDAHGDHRMAMAFSIAGLASEEGCLVDGFQSVDVSYPDFKEDIHLLGGRLEVVGD
ncbi:MAG: 3-phosphoshikimate 1-carboxyvinyltransferase [Nitrososphaerales archaeon]